MTMRLAARTGEPSRPTRTPRPPLSVAARIAQIQDTIQHLKLLAIATSVAGHAFSAAELLAHAALDEDLRCVLEGATTPKQVGRRLAQLAAQPCAAIRLVRCDRNEDGCIWTVEIQPDAGAPRETGV